MRLHSFAFSMGVGRSTFTGTRVFPPPFRVRFSVFCPLFFFFISRISRVEIWHSIFALLWSPRHVPAPSPPLAMFSIIFLSFSIPLVSFAIVACCFCSPHPSLSLSLIVGTIKKNSQASFAPIAVFILSIGLYLIRRILASYYVRGNIKAN